MLLTKGQRNSEFNTKGPLCAHCGLLCEDTTLIENGLHFCCKGCSSVFNLLNDNNLCNYYNEGSGLTSEFLEVKEFAYLDEEETSNRFIVFQNKEIKQFKFVIPEMHCNSCIYLLERLQKLHSKVLESRVDFFNKELLITAKNEDNILSSLVQLLYQLGYKPDLTWTELNGAKKKLLSSRSIKIGIAGFCFGNIMMLSFPEYLGLSLDTSSYVLKKWFDYISVFLSLPVFFYCSWEFFESSIKAIKQKTLNIDIPVSIAIVTTFLRSLYEIFISEGTGYLDSMTGIVFLLLLGRYFQDLSYNSLSFDRDYKSYFPLSARTIVKNETAIVNINALKENDVIELRNSELLPADAVLSSSFVSLDYSFITGESNPVAIQRGEKVYAGARVIGKAARFKLLGATDNSRLVKLWSIEKDAELKDNSLTEKINTYFTVALLMVSTVAFVYQYQLNGISEAIRTLTSVLIVACPCVLLLASTFANGHLLRTLKNNGMFVKNKTVLTSLESCDTIVFDKTGTLTDNSELTIEDLTNLNSNELIKIGFLCHQSVHPYSEAISKTYYNNEILTLDSYSDSIGKGIQGVINDELYRVGSALYIGHETDDNQIGQSALHIEKNGEYRGYFLIGHQLRPKVNSVMAELDSMSYKLYLSTGDSELNKEIQAKNFKQVVVKQEPEDKVKLVNHLKEQGRVVCMAGDGLNDAAAMKASDIGMSVADNEHAFFPACDVLLTSKAVETLPKLFEFIKKARWVLIISFIFSLIYNFFGLYYAITGQLSPLFAAILMPSSSISMLLLTWGLTELFAYSILRKEVN
ncbi:MAG: heavy metal translocating P-type ATPase metal-binding domain-containing protein [Bacteroidia bacterium]